MIFVSKEAATNFLLALGYFEDSGFYIRNRSFAKILVFYDENGMPEIQIEFF